MGLFKCRESECARWSEERRFRDGEADNNALRLSGRLGSDAATEEELFFRAHWSGLLDSARILVRKLLLTDGKRALLYSFYFTWPVFIALCEDLKNKVSEPLLSLQNWLSRNNLMLNSDQSVFIQLLTKTSNLIKFR